MRVNLIYNASAGTAHRAPVNDLIHVLEVQGFSVLYSPTSSEADLDDVLRHPGELIVVAGGDGSVRAVARRLLDRPESPPAMAIVPLGTSNNIGRTLRLTELAPVNALKGLNPANKCPFDVGRASGPWGERYFLESFGIGLLADLLRRYDPDAPKSVLRGVVP
ncbi:diacylglycerol kinase family protein (plasmid) [Deinococcus radiomollis]|uniref:diacylglycerol/lipid kinase family protein n=1 Tax=Deinococcus radiomollis TaxID=468916 RepID=UPI0038912FC9